MCLFLSWYFNNPIQNPKTKQEQFFFQIQSTDDGSPPLSVVAPVIVSVSDVNDKPSNMHLSKNTVRENKAPGTLVGAYSPQLSCPAHPQCVCSNTFGGDDNDDDDDDLSLIHI